MKRITAIIILTVMVITLSACKRKPESMDPGGAQTDASVSEQAEKETSRENTSDDQVSETTVSSEENINAQDKAESATDDSSDTEQSDTQQETQQPEESEQPEESGEPKESEEPAEPQEEYIPYLPVDLGYVEIVEKDGKKQYVAKQDKFTVELPITEEIRNKAWEYSNSERMTTNFLCNSYMKYGIRQNLQELEDNMFQNNCIIIKGVFLPEHGTSVIEYEKEEMNENVNRDYFYYIPHTRYKFQVEKIYTPCEGIKVGDIIPVVKAGGIEQLPDGNYLANEAYETMKYRDFTKKTVEERTFILAICDYNYDRFGGYENPYIFLNAYEQIENGTGDKDKQISYDILQKYN